MDDYEISGIENISRGICIVGGKVLLCRGKGLGSTYLPGGHIEFGETGREALVREMKEETGRKATAGAFAGVVENSFLQHGKKHCEINLVYEMTLAEKSGEAASQPLEEKDRTRSVTSDSSSLRRIDESTNRRIDDAVVSQEDWIGFEWCDVDKLDEANLLPVEMRDLVRERSRSKD